MSKPNKFGRCNRSFYRFPRDSASVRWAKITHFLCSSEDKSRKKAPPAGPPHQPGGGDGRGAAANTSVLIGSGILAAVQYPTLVIYQSPRLVFTHMPTVPVVGMGKEGRTIIDPWGSADREQDWQPYPVDAQSFESDNDTPHT